MWKCFSLEDLPYHTGMRSSDNLTAIYSES